MSLVSLFTFVLPVLALDGNNSYVSMKQDHFVSESSEKQPVSSLATQISFDPDRHSPAGGEILSQLSFDHDRFSYLNLSQIYSNLGAVAGGQLTFGRKKKDWSRVDRQWNLGLFQPVFSYNPLRKTQQGLTGLFFKRTTRNWQLNILASPLYIPNQSASVKVVDGKFIETSPWYVLPPDTIEFRGQPIAISYSVDEPQAADVVLQGSALMNFKYSFSKQLKAQISVGNKPVNQLALGLKGALNLGVDQAEIEVLPQVVRHTTYAADVRFDHRAFWTVLSFLGDEPDSPDFANEYTHQRFTGSQFISPALGLDFKRHQLSLSYIERVGGDAQEVGDFASDETSIFPGRFDYKRAARLSYRLNLQPFSLSSRFVRDLAEQTNLVSGQIDLKLAAEWQTFLGFDLIDRGSPEGQDPLGLQSANDRVFGGFSYVF